MNAEVLSLRSKQKNAKSIRSQNNRSASASQTGRLKDWVNLLCRSRNQLLQCGLLLSLRGVALSSACATDCSSVAPLRAGPPKSLLHSVCGAECRLSVRSSRRSERAIRGRRSVWVLPKGERILLLSLFVELGRDGRCATDFSDWQVYHKRASVLKELGTIFGIVLEYVMLNL
jgi:hypothetical protein